MMVCKIVSGHEHQLVQGSPGLADQHDVVGEEQGRDVDGVEGDT